MGALPIQKGSPCSVWLRTEASVTALLPTRAVNSFHPRKQLGIRFLLLSQVTVWYTAIQWYAKTALHESLFQSLTEEIPFISFKSPYGLLHCIELQQLQEFWSSILQKQEKKKIPKNVSKKVPIFFLKLSTWLSFFFPYPSTLYLKLSISVKHCRATKLLNLYVKALQGKIWTGT